MHGTHRIARRSALLLTLSASVCVSALSSLLLALLPCSPRSRSGFLQAVPRLKAAMDSRSIPDLKSSIAECKKLRGGDFDPRELAQSETLLAQLEVGGWEGTVCLAGWCRVE